KIDALEEACVAPAALRIPSADWRECAQQVAFAVLLTESIELGAELSHERNEVLGVLGRRIRRLASRDRPFPVDVDSIEDSGSRAVASLPLVRREVPLDVQIQAGVDELLTALGRGCCLGEV